MDKGWIKLHRKLMRSALWRDCNSNQKVIMVTLLMMASHDDNTWIFKGEEYTVQPGQFVTSLQKIAENSGTNINTVRHTLSKLKNNRFLTSKSTNRNTLITIENWGKYQGVDVEINKEINKDSNTKINTRTNTKTNNYQEDKEYKEVKKEDIYVQFVNGYHNICPSLARVIKITDSRKRAINARIKEDGLDVIKAVFEKVEASDFLTGRIGDFKATFDWILKPANFVKILEGNYDNRTDKPKRQSKQSDLEATFAAIDRLEQINGR